MRKRIITFILLCTMILSIGVTVFAAYDNTRLFFKNYDFVGYQGYRSEDFGVGKAGTYPSNIGWKNVTKSGKFRNNIYKQKTILGFIKKWSNYSEKTGTITSNTTGQSFQVRLDKGRYQVAFTSIDTAVGTLTGYRISWND